MGFKDSLISMVSDFVELKRNPEFRSKTDISSAQSTSATPFTNANRRHSLNITVGTVEVTPEKVIRQRTFSISTEAGQLRDRRDSSDSTSLKLTSVEEEGTRYAGKGRRASEPLNFVPANWSSGRAKQSRNLLGKSKRKPSVASSSLEECSNGSHRSPPQINLLSAQYDTLVYEDDSLPKSPSSPLFKNSYSKIHSSPIKEDWEAEKIAAGTEITIKVDGNKRSVGENIVTRF